MPSHNEQIAEIEALFRAGNDRMMSWPDTRERLERGEAVSVLCECGRRGCRLPVRITGWEYEAIRADARLFLVSPGHEMPETEDVVERHDSYLVVKKHEDVRDIVERMNLRRGGEGP